MKKIIKNNKRKNSNTNNKMKKSNKKKSNKKKSNKKKSNKKKRRTRVSNYLNTRVYPTIKIPRASFTALKKTNSPPKLLSDIGKRKRIRSPFTKNNTT
jgi:hypothetical protein